MREMTLGAYAHRTLPFEQSGGGAEAERDLSHPPLFQVMLVLQNAPGEVVELPGGDAACGGGQRGERRSSI